MYLVTGATGFVGKHLTDLLVQRPGAVRALVRTGSLQRFEELNRSRWGGRVEAVVGDLAEPRCGLDEEAIAALNGTTEVFHVAALYRLDADAEATRRANVDGTVGVLSLCSQLGARLHHVSTVGVAGDHRGAFAEDQLDLGQQHGHAYPSSKFEAEKRVVASDVRHRIYRPGGVVGSSTTGEADRADGLYMMFGLIRRLRGALPSWMPLLGYEGGPIPLAPVDFVAAAIDALGHAEGLDGRTFHLVDPNPPTLGEAANIVAEAAQAPRFGIRITPALFDLFPGVLPLLRGLGPVRRARKTILGGGDGKALLGLVSGRTTISSSRTWEELDQLGITCPPFAEYAPKLWDYWDRVLRPATRRTLESSVRGKVVMVTGASSGIGHEVARRVAADGARTVLVARSVDKLAALVAEIEAAGGEAVAMPCDLADADAAAALLASVIESYGGVDVLVNNAGRSIRRSVARSDGRFHDFERTMSLNYFGALRLILGVLPGMRERGDGHVVNVLTMGLQTRVPRYAAYIGSKAALEGASGSIAAEAYGDGVRFTAVYMPLVRTPMIEPSAIYRAWPALEVEEAAEMVCDAIVRRPVRVSTSLGTFSSAWGLLAPKLGLRILNRGSQMVPEEDSEAAVAEGEGSSGGGMVAKILASIRY